MNVPEKQIKIKRMNEGSNFHSQGWVLPQWIWSSGLLQLKCRWWSLVRVDSYVHSFCFSIFFFPFLSHTERVGSTRKKEDEGKVMVGPATFGVGPTMLVL